MRERESDKAYHNSVLVIVDYAEFLACLPVGSQFLVTKLS